MKTKFSGILTLLLAFVVQLTFAQEKTISGTVTDASGLPLPGTTVLIKGTSSGTSSDFDGKYAISTSQGATLVFSFVGYETQEILIGSSDVINVTENELLLTELAECTNYSLHIKTLCENGGSSIYSPAFEFRPSCINAVSEEKNENEVWSIYPNPTTDDFTISLEGETLNEAKISVFSADGKMISTITKNFSPTQNKLTIKSLQSQNTGVYFVKIQSNEKTKILKIVKQ